MATAEFSDDDALKSSSSNDLSDINTDDEEELGLSQVDEIDEGIQVNADEDEDENEDEEDEGEEEEEEDQDIEEDLDAEIPEDLEDADDYDENDDNDADIPSDTQDVESEDSDGINEIKVAPRKSNRPMRESKRRQLTFYEEDDLLDNEEHAPAPKKRQTKMRTPRRAASLTSLRTSRKDPDEFDEFELEYKPNPKKLTERQRAKLEEDPNEKYEDSIYVRMDQQLLALNRKTAKRIETAEQAALRRAENARKRAHYKVKQLEEAKRDTLNKLLKRRANKTREKEQEVDEVEEQLTLKPRRPVIGHPSLLRWVSRPEGILLASSEAKFFDP